MKMLNLFLVMTILCGVIYPAFVTLVGKIFFAHKAEGSLVVVNGKVKGSSLLAQKFQGEKFFHSRPSAADFSTIPSGASHLSVDKIKNKPSDAHTTSGSGLDPHISPENAFSQVPRVAKALRVDESSVTQLISSHIEGETLGIWGRPRVNVLELNIAILGQEHNGKSGSTP